MRPNQKTGYHNADQADDCTKQQDNIKPAPYKACGAAEAGIIIPPGCDNPMLHSSGEPVYTYTPASYRPYSLSESLPGAVPHSMSGRTGVISVPKCETPSATKSMTEYLNQFRGAYICLDLWSNTHLKIKKCGVLTESGQNFLVIRDSGSGSLSLIDLKPIRYINIYCK